jgi:site-specific recombinase XerD
MCEKAGDEFITNITSKVIRKALDRRKDTPEAANAFLKAVRGLFAFAVEYEHLNVNPAVRVKKLRSRNPNGWHTWTVEEVRQFDSQFPVGTKGPASPCYTALHGR